jgi:hypothetical protein
MHATHRYGTDKSIKKHRFNPLPLIDTLMADTNAFLPLQPTGYLLWTPVDTDLGSNQANGHSRHSERLGRQLPSAFGL